MPTNTDRYVSLIIRTTLALLILLSIGTMYYVLVVNKEYEIFTTPEGPDTSDYF